MLVMMMARRPTPVTLQEWIDRQVWLIVHHWYEPGRQDRSRRWIYRTKIRPVIPMSERTFRRCLERERERRKAMRNEK